MVPRTCKSKHVHSRGKNNAKLFSNLYFYASIAKQAPTVLKPTLNIAYKIHLQTYFDLLLLSKLKQIIIVYKSTQIYMVSSLSIIPIKW